MRVCVCARALFEGNLRLSGGSNGKKAPAKKKAQPKIDIVSETESSEEGACGCVGVDQEIISEIESSAIASRVCECVCVWGGRGWAEPEEEDESASDDEWMPTAQKRGGGARHAC